jgi:phosphopantothenoylcysteine decarboxylase/phosphopantothenate--cysteine ligase
MIAANWVGKEAGGMGFNSDDNALQLYWQQGELMLERAPKTVLAQRLMNVVAEHYTDERR